MIVIFNKDANALISLQIKNKILIVVMLDVLILSQGWKLNHNSHLIAYLQAHFKQMFIKF